MLEIRSFTSTHSLFSSYSPTTALEKLKSGLTSSIIVISLSLHPSWLSREEDFPWGWSQIKKTNLRPINKTEHSHFQHTRANLRQLLSLSRKCFLGPLPCWRGARTPDTAESDKIVSVWGVICPLQNVKVPRESGSGGYLLLVAAHIGNGVHWVLLIHDNRAMHDVDLSVQINASQHRWLQCVRLHTQIHGKILLLCKQDEKIQYLWNMFDKNVL